VILIAGIYGILHMQKPRPAPSPDKPARPLIFDFEAFKTAYWKKQLGGNIETLTFSLDRAPLLDVLGSFSEFSVRNIINIPDPEVIQRAITVQLDKKPWPAALDLVFKEAGLDCFCEANCVIIETKEGSKRFSGLDALVFAMDQSKARTFHSSQ